MADTFVRADIFFFITSIAVIIISVALVAALLYAIQILRDVRYVTKRARQESDRILSDVEDARRFLKKEGEKIAGVKELAAGAIGAFLAKRKPYERKNRKTR